MQVGKEEGKVLVSRPAGDQVSVDITGVCWRGFNVRLSRSLVRSADGSQPYRHREQNGAAAGNAGDTANMSPDGRGGTGYALKK